MRMVVPLLDPAALAPLDAALHPDAEQTDPGWWRLAVVVAGGGA
jgi:hypothetical protein